MRLIQCLKVFVTRARLLSPWIVYLADLFWAIVSSFVALLYVAYMTGLTVIVPLVYQIFAMSAVCSAFSIFIFKTYTGIIRHSTLVETGRIVLTSGVKSVCMFLLARLLLHGFTLRMLILGAVTDLLLTFLVYTMFRVVLILVYRLVSSSQGIHRERMLIYMGEDRSLSLSGALFGKLEAYSVAGYLRIGRQSVMRSGLYTEYSVRNFEDLSRLVATKRVNCLLFVSRYDLEREQERLVRFCEKLKLRMLLLPSVDEVKEGHATYRHLPEVRIEDLLGRDEIKINMGEIASQLKGKVVMVTGAAGSIGSELCRQLCTFDLQELILLDSAETPMHHIRLELEDKFPEKHFIPVIGDIRSKERLKFTLEKCRPQIIFHAAAYKHVPLMEENPCEAVRTNVYGTRLLADLAVKYGVERFVMISTDKAVNPTNVMGASKRLAEIYVQSLSIALSHGEVAGKTRFITTRFGNVLGSNGSVIPRFREQLEKGGPLTVTHPDIIRYFMTIPEACRLVLEASVMGQGNEIFVFDMGKPVKIADLARRMIELAGLVPGKDIQITYTGLRPGEKLYEELLATKENTLPTPNEKIFRAHVREYAYADIAAAISRLSDIAATVDRVATVREMKRLVPEFKSKNSLYEKLDKFQIIPKHDSNESFSHRRSRVHRLQSL